jgi:hypothetical protein
MLYPLMSNNARLTTNRNRLIDYRCGNHVGKASGYGYAQPVKGGETKFSPLCGRKLFFKKVIFLIY